MEARLSICFLDDIDRDAEFPGSVPWLIRHPFTMIAIEFGVTLVGVVMLISLIDGLSHR